MVDLKKGNSTNKASPVENCSGSVKGKIKETMMDPDREGDVEGDGEGVVVPIPSKTQLPGSPGQ